MVRLRRAAVLCGGDGAQEVRGEADAVRGGAGAPGGHVADELRRWAKHRASSPAPRAAAHACRTPASAHTTPDSTRACQPGQCRRA
ncbi:hypothetical protein [Frigoriglobus tundricola]|uniref:hypothetical protein n=1 Tax=Frigoriglobus tundricola TaxID=2774151 RepID=UPI00148EDBA6|nr:hypothetical protein [Frigoriglobus tundricola]